MLRLVARATLAALAVAGGSAPALAGPTYLVCGKLLPGETTPSSVERFALDEGAQSVTVTMPNGNSHSARAAFSAATVTFADPDFLWQIDRSTLDAQIRADISGRLMGPMLPGKCQIEQAPPRAF